MNAIYPVLTIIFIKLHHLLPFDDPGNVVDEEDLETRLTLISMRLTISRKNASPLSVPIRVRDERATKSRFCEQLTPVQRIPFRIVLFVLRHILEVPFILGLDFYLLQVDLTISVEEHHELPAWYKICHYERGLVGAFLPGVEPMKVQGMPVLAPRFNPWFIRSHPGNSPVFEFCRRRNGACGDGDLKSCHLIEPSLVVSGCLVESLASLQRSQEQKAIRWDGILTAERFRTSSTSQSLNIFNNTSKGRPASSWDWSKLSDIKI